MPIHIDAVSGKPHISSGVNDQRATLRPQGAQGRDGSNVLPTDTAIKNAMVDPVSQTYSALRTAGGDMFAVTDGTARQMRTLASHPGAGTIDWGFGGGVAGYLFHLRSEVDSVFGEYAIAVGTDKGAGGGALFSLKNSSGVGIRMIQNPGSAVGVYHDNYSTNLAAWHRISSNAGAFRVDALAGAGFTDGVANTASTTFTSATAAFTAGDTGATLTITHTSAGAVVNTSFTVTYVSATTVTLSAVAGITGTALRFTISGRVGIAAQTLIEARDTDGTTTLFKVGRGEHMFSGSAGQSTSILKVFKAGNGTPVLEVDSTGKQLNKFATDLNNAGQTGAIPLAVRNYGTGVPSVQIQGVASQGTDQLRITDVSGVVQSRFDKNGHFMTRKTAAPADADLANGELAIWIDQTIGATKAMFKAKDSAGTVRTATVALA